MAGRAAAVSLLLAVVVAACGTEAEPGATADPATDEEVEVLPDVAEPDTDASEPEAPDADGGQAEEPEAVEPEDGGAVGVLEVASSPFGEILVDGDGMTVYLFTPDEQGGSTCEGDCAEAWPPIAGPLEAGPGVDPGLLGTAPRSDGSAQATYAGWPLYLFAGDAEPGDTNGQGLNGVWWVLAPDGEMVEAMASARFGY